MSDDPSGYKVAVTAANVPEALIGVPMPIEAVSSDGCLERALLILQEGATTEVTVTQAGNCLIRAKLPSGKWIAAKALVDEKPPGENGVSASVTLDFGTEASTTTLKLSPESSETEVLFGAMKVQLHKIAKRVPRSLPLLTDISKGVSQLTNAGVNMMMRNFNLANSAVVMAEGAQMPDAAESDSQPVTTEEPGDSLTLSLDYGLFEKWIRDADGSSAQPSDTLVLQSMGRLTTNLPGSVTFPQTRETPSDNASWKPLLVRTAMRKANETVMTEALLVCPPSLNWKPMVILPDSDNTDNPISPPLHALTESDDRTVDALFAYVRNGSLETARQALPAYIAQAQELLEARVANPMTATLAAYALLRLGNTDHSEWVANLANSFPYLPDGPIAYGWNLIRLGQAAKAGEQFHASLARGVPIYSEGVRLLRDGLNFLKALYPEDAQIQQDSALSYGIAASANLTSELTCLRIGKYFSVRVE